MKLIRPSRRSLLTGLGASIASPAIARRLIVPSISPPASSSGGGPTPYIAPAVHFDGNTTLYRSSPLIGVIDGPLATLSFWWNTLLNDGVSLFEQDIIGTQTELDINNKPDSGWLAYNVFSHAPAGGVGSPFFEILDYSADFSSSVTGSADVETSGNGWNHIMVSTTTNRAVGSRIIQVAVNAVVYTVTIPGKLQPADRPGSFNQALATVGTTIGSGGFHVDGTLDPPIFGDIADVYFNTVVALDLTNSSNIAIFRNPSTGKPVNPTTFPSAAICLSGAAANFANNTLGTGGAYLIGGPSGILTNAPTSPSD